MDSSELIYLPVSIGEAIDKLTILDIKLTNIKDNRRDNVLVEYNLLYEKLSPVIQKYTTLYNAMKKINSIIWRDMDILRDPSLKESDYIQLCKKTIDYNDIRFRIKNKINILAKSSLKEQKGYKINSILIEINDSLTSLEHFVAPIQYLSYLYDKIVIIYHGDSEFHNLFNDDATIIFKLTKDDIHVYNKQYHFVNDHYSKEAILDIFGINDEMIYTIL
jgi:hypothetical protein